MRFIFLTIALACAMEATAQSPSTIDTDKVCRDTKVKPLTEPTINGPLSGKALAECNTAGLYYGVFGNRKNLAAALQCGWYQRSHPEAGNKDGDMFHGVGMLTMLYANGLGGASQDYDLAIRFACEMGDAADDNSRRIKHLDSLKNANPLNGTFGLCDDAGSRFAGFACQQVTEDLRRGGRDKDLESISSKLTAPQKRVFDRLRAAEEAFESARTDNEIDMTGAFRQSFVLEDLDRLREQFLINLQRFSKGDIPQATPADVRTLDARLNAEYQRIIQLPRSAFEDTTVKSEGIRVAQRAWIPLRDAWVEFAKSVYPKLSTDRVTAQIIRLRLDQLQKLP